MARKQVGAAASAPADAMTRADVAAYWTANVATGDVVFVDAIGDLPSGTPVDTLVVVRA